MACHLDVVLDRLQDAPRGAQEAPRPPQERPKRLQEAPKSAPRGSKRASRHPESRSRGLKSLKTHPKRLQKTLSTLSIQTKHFEELQRCPARMPCHTITTGDAESWRAGGGVPPKGKAIRRPPRRGGAARARSTARSVHLQAIICLRYLQISKC